MKDYILIYVFGPTKSYNDYIEGKVIEWVKIGLHRPDASFTFKPDTISEAKDIIFKEVLNRINQEVRTGIPVTCRIYDVKIFPSINSKKEDDIVRSKLSDELYSDIETSKNKNKNVGLSDPYEIKAGQEFVYNVRKKQINNAFELYTLSLIDRTNNENEIKEIKELRKYNSCTDMDSDDTNESNDNVKDKEFYNSIWTEIDNRTSNIKITGNGRPYVLTKSHNHPGCRYYIVISKRYQAISISFESFAKGIQEGDYLKINNKQFENDTDYRDLILDSINNSDIDAHIIDTVTPEQGVKRIDKYAWTISKSLENLKHEDIIEWISKNVDALSGYFESLSFK